MTLCALALGVVLGGCAGGTEDDDPVTDSASEDTSYEGMRVRKVNAGWRLPGAALPQRDAKKLAH